MTRGMMVMMESNIPSQHISNRRNKPNSDDPKSKVYTKFLALLRSIYG
jgi:hypothetical protein